METFDGCCDWLKTQREANEKIAELEAEVKRLAEHNELYKHLKDMTENDRAVLENRLERTIDFLKLTVRSREKTPTELILMYAETGKFTD